MCVMLAHSALAHASVPALGVQTPDTHSLWRPHKPTMDSTQSPTQASAAVQVCHLPAATGRPHVRSRGLWGGGQVSRQQAMLPGLASSPGFQNDPPPHSHPSSGPRLQGHAVRPPGVLSLDADRAHGGVWHILTQPPASSTVLPVFPTCWATDAADTRHLPPPTMGRGLPPGLTLTGLPRPPSDLGQVLLLRRPQFSHLENGRESRLELSRSCPWLAVRFSHWPREKRRGGLGGEI
jgi:hypothetical protein